MPAPADPNAVPSRSPATDEDAEVFFAKEWRWLETRDQNWEHMTPIQGDWKISSIGLPAAVLRKVYFDNARKLLAGALPPPSVQARRLSRDLDLEGHFDDALWQTAKPVQVRDAHSPQYSNRDPARRRNALAAEPVPL